MLYGQVPNYSPRDVIENLRRRIKGQGFVEMQPWYSGFAGSITVSGLFRLWPFLFSSSDLLFCFFLA